MLAECSAATASPVLAFVLAADRGIFYGVRFTAGMMEMEFITFACSDPDGLATFWAEALGGERRGLPASIDPVIVDRPGDGPDLLFKDLPKGTRRDLPIHLDFATADREATVDRLLELGATFRETKTETFETHVATWTILEDPEGNGFCVSEY